MVNCNPETVSTDYDTSDRLFFEPLTFEDVMEIIDKEKPVGVIMQYGGQTPLKLCRALEAAGAPIIGTTPDAIDVAEDRERFQQLVQPAESEAAAELHGPHRRAGHQHVEDGRLPAGRASFVCARRSRDGSGLQRRRLAHLHDRCGEGVERQPVLLDRFLDQAIEVDVDAICDGEDVYIGGIMEHVEQAGVHSGDSGCSLPPNSLSAETAGRSQGTDAQARQGLKVVGLMNIQFAIQSGIVYILEVNPRASRTVPFVSKATGVPLAKMAARVMARREVERTRLDRRARAEVLRGEGIGVPVREVPEADPILGPEMKSTGEVMGTGRSFGEAYAKAQLASGVDPADSRCLLDQRARARQTFGGAAGASPGRAGI